MTGFPVSSVQLTHQNSRSSVTAQRFVQAPHSRQSLRYMSPSPVGQVSGPQRCSWAVSPVSSPEGEDSSGEEDISSNADEVSSPDGAVSSVHGDVSPEEVEASVHGDDSPDRVEISSVGDEVSPDREEASSREYDSSAKDDLSSHEAEASSPDDEASSGGTTVSSDEEGSPFPPWLSGKMGIEKRRSSVSVSTRPEDSRSSSVFSCGLPLQLLPQRKDMMMHKKRIVLLFPGMTVLLQ